MWTRAELKFRAKNNIRRYFWPALAVSMINSLFNSNGGSSSGSGANAANAGANISQEYNFNLEESLSGGLDSVISEIPQMAEGIVDSANAATVSVFLIGLLIGGAIALAVGVFVAPIIEVGKNRFYMESRQRGRTAGMDCLLYGFKNEYLNIIWTMLVRNILVFLGTLCFVFPGIYLGYCYHMVPYILAENPDMRTSDVLCMSKDMMRGHKLSTWVLKLSFIGWWILGALACGIGSFLVLPYYDGTLAELYAVLRNPYTNYLNGFGSSDYHEYQERTADWQQTYEQPRRNVYEETYSYSYEQPIKTEPVVNAEPPVHVNDSAVKHAGDGSVRGYYLNGEFHPYTEEELKELEKNGY